MLGSKNGTPPNDRFGSFASEASGTSACRCTLCLYSDQNFAAPRLVAMGQKRTTRTYQIKKKDRLPAVSQKSCCASNPTILAALRLLIGRRVASGLLDELVG
jgi:hypothetical protein